MRGEGVVEDPVGELARQRFQRQNRAGTRHGVPGEVTYVERPGPPGSSSLCSWYHVVAVYRSALPAIPIYLIGVEASGSAHSTPVFSIHSGNEPLRIGGSVNRVGSLVSFDGDISDVRVYDQALTAAEIRALAVPQVTFGFVGAAQTWVVPNNVTSVTVDARGAQGGGNGSIVPGGKGGRVQTTLAVTPGETLVIHVGGRGGDLNTGGPGGFNGGAGGGIDNVDFNSSAGGGGGASDVRRGGGGLVDRVVVAGGRGGSECCKFPDGNGVPEGPGTTCWRWTSASCSTW